MSENKNTSAGDVALVMESFINGLGVMRGLKKDKSVQVWLISFEGDVSSVSKCADRVFYIKSRDEIKDVLIEINSLANCVIPYPCSDENYRELIKSKEQLTNFKIPWNDTELLDKAFQVELAKESGVPYPETVRVDSESAIEKIKTLKPPYVVKPVELPNLARSERKELFKVEICEDLDQVVKLVSLALEMSVACVVSEYIYGEEENLITYGGSSKDGQVITEYVGRKLVHSYPSRVVAIAETLTEMDQVLAYGKSYLTATNFTGMFQLELKYCDVRKDYFLIEFNTRNWLWGSLAIAEGFNHALSLYKTETNEAYTSEKGTSNHSFVWFLGMLSNCAGYKTVKPLGTFLKLMVTRKVVFAVFSLRDSKPFFRLLLNHILYVLGKRSRLN